MLLKNAEAFIDGAFRRVDIRVLDGRIAEIKESLSGEPAIDLAGRKLLPGLIDIHTHGCVGYDFSDATASQMQEMTRFYARHGITSILATTMTMPFESHLKAMQTVRQVMSAPIQGSRILGINMEGPFLGTDKKGAHDPQYLTPINFEQFAALDEASGGNIRIVDIDPTLDHAVEFVQKYAGEKVISLAHTSCTYATAKLAIEAGANHVTHLFNAMNSLHHREPGLIGAVSDFEIYAEIISDGIHVHPVVIRMMFKLAGKKMVLISDSMRAAGLEDGLYELGGQKVYVKNKMATLADGTIAGSTTTVYEAMRNAVSFGVPLEDAVLSATEVPARSIQKEKSVGVLCVGAYADLLVLEQDLSIAAVYVNGQKQI